MQYSDGKRVDPGILNPKIFWKFDFIEVSFQVQPELQAALLDQNGSVERWQFSSLVFKKAITITSSNYNETKTYTCCTFKVRHYHLTSDTGKIQKYLALKYKITQGADIAVYSRTHQPPA